jgi:hypothetical protein
MGSGKERKAGGKLILLKFGCLINLSRRVSTFLYAEHLTQCSGVLEKLIVS